jgi:hypothetical protein
MRTGAYIHGSGGRVSDVIAATRLGMSPPSIYTGTPEMVEARDRRVAGVKFIPASVGRSIIYPLDNEARSNLNTLFFSIYAGIVQPLDTKLKLPVIDPDDENKFHMALFTLPEIQNLGIWAIEYTYALYDYADRLHLGETRPDEQWPNNDFNAPRPTPIFKANPQR